ncbi:hypothetical protein [Natrialba sp. PRR66]|uniref:DUF7283 family protein n=1 Tax=Natrialba sp. PRR66 TaxID=3098146 RepID=UPI002B1DECD1|nr:hypothetical protein [Natrialba sp. PRR66]
MDLDAPADAWYVYVAVAIVSVALAGLALGVSTGPPPDAERAATTIEGATTSEYPARATAEHDAETVTIDRKTITMENDHGTSHASVDYGVVVPVRGNERLENLSAGAAFKDEYADALEDGDRHAFAEFQQDVESAFDENSGRPIRADGDLRARQVTVDAAVDELDPVEERLTIEVTEDWEPLLSTVPDRIWDPDPYIGAMQVTYTGPEDRRATIHMNGEYRLSDILPDAVPNPAVPDPEPLDETVELAATGHGSTSTVIRPRSDGQIDISLPGDVGHLRSSQPARDPIEFSVEATDPSGDLPSATGSGELEYADGSVEWTNEVERDMEFDHEHPAIGRNDGGNYYVTLVAV